MLNIEVVILRTRYLSGLDPFILCDQEFWKSSVASGDQISAKILLSKDLMKMTDFILREFELGSKTGGIERALAGETINLFQQMPDNFEGDYYLIMSIDNVGDAEDELKSIESTPIITLSSQGAGTTTVLDTTIDGLHSSERPDASKDGRFVTYEKPFLLMGRSCSKFTSLIWSSPIRSPN